MTAAMEPQNHATSNRQPPATSQALPRKFSRYRTVRQAASKVTVSTESLDTYVPPDSNSSPYDPMCPQNAPVARSTSRYHRAKPTTAPSAPLPSPGPAGFPLASVPGEAHYQKTIQPAVDSQPVRTQLTPPREMKDGVAVRQRSSKPTNNMSKTAIVTMTELTSGENHDHEAAKMVKEQKRREALAALTGELPSRPEHALKQTSISSSERREQIKEQEESPSQPKKLAKGSAQSPPLSNHSQRSSWKDKVGLSRPKTAKENTQHLERNHESPIASRAGESSGVIIAPGFDAPLSAVNAGERRVRVKYKGVAITLPVTPTTSAQDLLFSAANCLSYPIDPKKGILLESFEQLGLERPLRRYEHVRDVMNSWATDSSNELLLSTNPVDGQDKLHLNSAPDKQPEEATFQLHCSHRPGKWDKRYVILRSDGQVCTSKHADGHDSTNICHLSDFDIHTPAGRHQMKSFRFPKKLCFVVKSQQKSSMFLSTEKFIHLFCTNDDDLAHRWYDAVHSWRSWYLVHVLGEGQKNINKSPQSPTTSPHHRRYTSTDSTPYQLGSFKPLLDLSFIDNVAEAHAVEEQNLTDPGPPSKSLNSKDMYIKKKKGRERDGPPPSFRGGNLNLETASIISQSRSTRTDQVTSPDSLGSAAFSPDSLLGRTYSVRLKAQREREERLAEENEKDQILFSHGLLGSRRPTVSGASPSYLSDDSVNNQDTQFGYPPSAKKSVRKTPLSRSGSIHQTAKPLVDLTPVYQEPPQHSRKGHAVRAQPGVSLLEAASGSEFPPGAIVMPSSTTWRKPGTSINTNPPNVPILSRAISSASRQRANTVNAPPNINLVRSPVAADHERLFVPSSLLDRSVKPSQSAIATGRGDRTRAKPLLDLMPKSQFTEGSLLHRIED